ncbi:PspC domain-containing protein [Bacillus sp. FJAT-47783]|uniref:PspC domain-containing protein n=1 Tax=Bacillus sp. FJAT-47783 TaxID=2922712 RepID=UPI001FAB5B72|nr:PspC domain-containing protein [Bacillus sp. FJAT-47783]
MKRLYRKNKGRKLGGVLGGIAQYFQIDPTLVRLIFIILFIVTSFIPFAMIYVVAYVIMPEEEDVGTDAF